MMSEPIKHTDCDLCMAAGFFVAAVVSVAMCAGFAVRGVWRLPGKLLAWVWR